MIDKSVVSIEDFEIRENAKLILQPANFNIETGEELGNFNLFDINGNTQYAKKAFHNSKYFNVDITHRHDKTVLSVSFSPTKVYNQKDNFNEITKDQTKQAYEYVQNELTDAGIMCNLESGNLSRIDLFHNAELDYKFNLYEPLLSVMKCKRKMNKTDFGGTGYLFRNTQQETAIYDKVQEQKDKIIKEIRFEHRQKYGTPAKVKHIKTELTDRLKQYPQNVARFEQRLLNKNKIVNVLSISKLEETINNYDLLTDYYKASMENGLFKHTFDEIKVLTAESLTIGINYYYNLYKRGWFEKYLAENGLKTLLNFCDVQTLLDAVAK